MRKCWRTLLTAARLRVWGSVQTTGVMCMHTETCSSSRGWQRRAWGTVVHSGPQEGVHTALVPGAVRLRQPRSAHPNPAPSQGPEPWKAAPPTALGESLDSRILVSPLFAPKLSSASELNLVSFYWLEGHWTEHLWGTNSGG